VSAAPPILDPPPSRKPASSGKQMRLILLALWLFILTYLAAGVIQSFGAHIGPQFFGMLPSVISWVFAQPVWIQAILIAGLVILILALAYLTYLAWRTQRDTDVEKQEAQMEAQIEAQRSAFEGALDAKVSPDLQEIKAQRHRLRCLPWQGYKPDAVRCQRHQAATQ
jgi:type VI protein secretion system component VasK